MDLMELYARLGLDDSEYRAGLGEAEDAASSSGSKIGSFLGTAGKVAGAAIAAGAAAVTAITKQSVEAYADFEQNVGGIQKLYGNMGMSVEEYAANVGKSVDEVSGEWQRLENAQNLVLQNAQNAYATAGMSANDYMETATSFSAALINSVGGDSVKAAELTDVAMRSIADNWNTFGGDIEGIKTAYSGFAKQNYTMLDNLKLGYGGTKAEMERLIEDANAYAESIGQTADLSIDSYADIVQAIDLVQQKQNIAGTTAREASTTISGSLGMTKAAWENLLVGLADGSAEIEPMIENLVDSLVGFTDETGEHVNGLIDNIIPVIEQVLVGIAELLEGIAPMLTEMLPTLIEQILPPLIGAATSLVLGLVEALPEIIQVLIDIAPEIIMQIITAITEMLPAFIELGMQAIQSIGQGTDQESPNYIAKFTQLILGLIQNIGANLPQFLQKGSEIIINMITGLTSKLPDIVNSIVTIAMALINTIVANLPLYMEKGGEIILSMISGIGNALPSIIAKIAELLSYLITTIVTNLPEFVSKGFDLIVSIISGIGDALPDIISAIWDMVVDIGETIMEMDWLSIGIDLIEGIVDGVVDAAWELADAALDAVKEAWNSMTSWLDINSPSRKARDQIGKMWARGIGIGFKQGMPVDDMVGAVEGAFDEVGDIEPPLFDTDGGMMVDKMTFETGSDSEDAGYSPVTINVYGTDGQSAKEIAEEVQRQFVLWERQRRAAYA